MAKPKTVTSEVIVLDDTRLSFVKTEAFSYSHLSAADQAKGGKDPRYSITGILDPKNPKTKPGIEFYLQECRRIAQIKWDADPLEVRRMMYKLGIIKSVGDETEDGIKLTSFVDGNKPDKKGRKREETKDMYVVNAHNTLTGYERVKNNAELSDAARKAQLAKIDKDNKPVVANRRGVVVEPGQDQYIYSGCYGRLKCNVWTSDHDQGGRQLITSFRSVQYLRKGDAFGRPVIDPDKEFEKLEDDEDADEAFEDTSAAEDWDN